MSPTTLLRQLQALQAEALRHLDTLDDGDVRTQYHPELSPIGWHIGHLAFIECYWIRETLLADARASAALRRLYAADGMPKTQRGAALPPKGTLAARTTALFAENLELLAGLVARDHDHALLHRHYLLHFLIQHHAQHLETLQQILQQRALVQTWHAAPNALLTAADGPQTPLLPFPAQTVEIGHAPGPIPFDNELPRHAIDVAAFRIGARPVSNAQYLGFMHASGYRRRELWSEAGWRWCTQRRPRAPQHWRAHGTDAWFAIEADGPAVLVPAAPVYGINHYEAGAFARYAGARLPTEAEWETAARHVPEFWGSVGGAWEWCANAFHPYPGFKPFPYDGYSVPWYDGAHFGLRGASRCTAPHVRRPSFRNFYTADKRHVFAGLRLAAE